VKMKIIGLIGGMSWESTQHYYELMNRYVHEKLGGHNSMEAIIYSVNFERILKLVNQDQWSLVEQDLLQIAKKLETAGVDFLILTANAIHKVFPEIEKAIHIPILHIVDPTGDAIQKAGIKKVGLLGTKVTMGEPFYKERLQEKYGIETLVPNEESQESLHKIIFDELTIGITNETSKKTLISVISELYEQGAQGVILGCTELTLLVTQKETSIPLFDTTSLHAKAAVDLALLT